MRLLSPLKGPPILEGPYGQLRIGEVLIEIFVKRGQSRRIDTKRHGKLARQAADMRPKHSPNPCLVPLDPEEQGGPYVYAKVTILGPSPLIFHNNVEALAEPVRGNDGQSHSHLPNRDPDEYWPGQYRRH